MIIDAHSHIFPTPLAEKATEAIGDFYEIPMQGLGSVEALLKSGAEIGVDKYLVCSAATSPKQVQSINDFIHRSYLAHEDKFIPYGTLHPYMEDVRGEIERILELGLKGVKLHSDFQRFAVDDPLCDPMYAMCADVELPILFHAGDKRFHYSNPHQLADVAKRFPSLTVWASHLGGYSEWDEAKEIYEGLDNVVFDCSSSLAMISPERGAEQICALGVHRVMWGSDFPMWDHKSELERFMALGLSDAENMEILHKNACRILCV